MVRISDGKLNDEMTKYETMKGKNMGQNLIFGHKKPDTDSVCAAIALALLKNKLGEASEPYILGNINKETEFVLNYFNIEVPQILDNVKIQIKDLDYDRVKPFNKDLSVHFAYFNMYENKRIIFTSGTICSYDYSKFLYRNIEPTKVLFGPNGDPMKSNTKMF